MMQSDRTILLVDILRGNRTQPRNAMNMKLRNIASFHNSLVRACIHYSSLIVHKTCLRGRFIIFDDQE